jgi:hypothetical protein
MTQYWIHTLTFCQLIPSRRSQTHQQGGVSWTLKAGIVSVVAVLLVVGDVFDMTKIAGVGPVAAQVAAGGGQGKLAQTYAIDPASFELVSQAAPAIEVKDGVTIYTLTASGTVTFHALDAGARTIEVDANDLIIERPAAGSVTVVRDR